MLSWIALSATLCAMPVGSASAQQSLEDPSVVGVPDTIDACVALAPPDCFGFAPDCTEMCGDPFTPGAPLCSYADDGTPLWVCCPSGYSLQLDYTCTRDP